MRAPFRAPWPGRRGALLLALGMLWAASAQARPASSPPTSWRLDLRGGGESALKGWSSVTPKARPAGVRPGFVKGGRIIALGHKSKRRFLHPLVRHGVLLNGRLEVPLPPGRYAVWLLVGGLGQRWLSGVIDDVEYGLKVEGQVVRARPAAPAAARRIHQLFHAGWDRVYRPADDPWALQVVPLFQQHMVDVQVSDGSLTIEGDKLQLRALALEPAASRKKLAADVIATWQEFALHFARVVDPREAAPAHPGRAPSKAERQSGLQLWRQPVMEPMAPGSRPPASSEARPSPVVLPVGGRAIVVLGVRTLKTLRAARLSVRWVGGGSANASPLRWRLRRLAYNWRADGLLRPSHLLPVAADDASGGLPGTLDPGLARAVWLDLSLPSATAQQRGQVEITVVAGAASATLRVPVQLRSWRLVPAHEAGQFVLQNARPSALASHGGRLFPNAWAEGRAHVSAHLKTLGMLPQVSEIDGRVVDVSGPEPRVRFRAADKARFVADVAHHRATFVGVPVTVTMHWSISGRRFAMRWIRGAPAMSQPAPFFRAMRLYVEAMEAVRRSHPDWPEFRYVLAAEPGNRFAAGVRYGREILQATRPTGVRTIACLVTPSAVHGLRPLADIIATNIGVPGEDPSVSDLPDGATERWVYQFARRLETGFLAARLGATGGFREFYQQGHGRAFNNFDGDDMALGGLALPIPGGVVSTPGLERMALGIVDLRVVETLRRLIRRARGSQDSSLRASGERALDVLAGLLAKVETDTWTQHHLLGPWSPDAWGRVLARLVAEIDHLESALAVSKQRASAQGLVALASAALWSAPARAEDARP